MKRIQIYIGHNVKGKPTHDRAHVLQTVQNVLQVEAFTAYAANGMWQGEGEESTVCIFSALTAKEAEAINERLPYLVKALDQFEILAEESEVKATFIKAHEEQQQKTA